MNIDKKLELLKKIQRVDAPPFMLTRILQRVQPPSSAPAPVAWRLAFVVTAIVILSLNVSIFFKSSSTKSSKGIEEVVTSMELSTTNELYHE